MNIEEEIYSTRKEIDNIVTQIAVLMQKPNAKAKIKNLKNELKKQLSKLDNLNYMSEQDRNRTLNERRKK